MKIYTYSQARQRLADILRESKTEEVLIRRRSGETFAVIPKAPTGRSPFDVPAITKKISVEEILDALRESRER